MKVLVLGGSVFVGRAIVEAALARGHELTLFNRGQHSPDLFPEVEKLRGDRAVDLSALRGRRWDAVIDTCGYLPRVVRASAELLAPAVGHYTFISTCSVYPELGTKVCDETSTVGTMSDPTVEEITGETYGPLKVLCEQAVQEALPGRALIIRPGLIVGPHDPTDRFTYWPSRIARGGEVLAPDQPNCAFQVIIDVRDLAEWTMRLVERGAVDVLNASGPESPITFGALAATCKEVSGSDATFTWVPEGFLVEQGASPWIEVPLWVPGMDFMIDPRKPLGAGLTFRPLAQTIADTLAWAATLPADRTWAAGLSPDRERALLDAWHQHE